MKSFDVLVLKGSARNLLVVSKHHSFVSFPSTDGRGACWKRGDRAAPSGLSGRRSGDVTWKTDVCLALLRFVFFNSHFWCPQKLNKGLKCLCLSLDKRRPAGRNTSTSVLTKPAADSLPIVSCAAGQGWQIHWNEQTNCKFWFFLSDLLPSISNLLNKQSGLEANTHD